MYVRDSERKNLGCERTKEREREKQKKINAYDWE